MSEMKQEGLGVTPQGVKLPSATEKLTQLKAIQANSQQFQSNQSEGSAVETTIPVDGQQINEKKTETVEAGQPKKKNMYKQKQQKPNNESKRERSAEREKQPPKVHEGLYIAGERRKANKGIIRGDSLPNKIEVNGKDLILHQSRIQWVEIRRYLQYPKNKAQSRLVNKQHNQNRKNETEHESSETNQNKQIPNKDNQKPKGAYRLKNTNKKNKQISNNSIPATLEQKQKSHSDITREKKLDPIKTAQQAGQQNQTSLHLEKQTAACDQSSPQVDSKRVKNSQQGTPAEGGKGSDSQSDNSAQEDSDQPKEPKVIIVARITKVLSVSWFQKSFVAILSIAEKRRKPLNLQGSVLHELLATHFIDLEPIHPRLPKMELDEKDKGSIEVINSYIKKEKLKSLGFNDLRRTLNQLYVKVVITEADHRSAFARIEAVLGQAFSVRGECQCFLHEHQLSGFEYETLEEGKQAETPPLQKTKSHKVSQRLVFSIDPPTSIDLDDALSIQKLSPTEFSIGIHIADVTSYLKFMDWKQLVRRTTSVYLPHKVFHMLPEHLLSICSLNQGAQRSAFTIYVQMNAEGDVIGESRLEKTIIKSRYKLHYDLVQDIITGKCDYLSFSSKHPCTEQEYQRLSEDLLNLASIATEHRKKRVTYEVFENTTINFEFKLDDKDKQLWPVDFNLFKRFKAQKVVEQFMILGNIEAAKHCIKHYGLESLVIYHPCPSKQSVNNFHQFFASVPNFKFKFGDISAIQAQISQILQDTKIPEAVKKAMIFKVRRAQQAANYSKYGGAIEAIKAIDPNSTLADPVVHFALGLPFYTHFTSPMRRLADVFVHLLLNRIVLQPEDIIEHPMNEEEIQALNEGRKNTKRLKKDLNQVYLCLLLHKTKRSLEQEAVILSLGKSSVSIYLPSFDITKELLWKELRVEKVYMKGEDAVKVWVYKDKNIAYKDKFWIAKKFDNVKLRICCTRDPPLRLKISLQVKTTTGYIYDVYSDLY